MTDPLIHQHQVTEGGRLAPVETLIANTATGRRTKVTTYQREAHAKLWAALSETQQSAAEYIQRCYRVIHGSPAPAINLANAVMPRGQPIAPEPAQAMRNDYFAWQTKCMKARVDHHLAIVVFCEGGSVNSISKSAWARKQITIQLHAALDVMSKLRGWR